MTTTQSIARVDGLATECTNCEESPEYTGLESGVCAEKIATANRRNVKSKSSETVDDRHKFLLYQKLEIALPERRRMVEAMIEMIINYLDSRHRADRS